MVDFQKKTEKLFVSPGTFISDQIGDKVFVKAAQALIPRTWENLTWEEREELSRLHLSGFALGRLYNDILNEGKKIRVVKKDYHGEDAFVVETYDEYGWWIFKTKSLRRTEYIFRDNKIIDLDVDYS